MNKFLHDRDILGAPLEQIVAQHLYSKGIPFGFNPASGTEDPAREDFDIYVGQPGAETFLELKMDWASAFSPNLFIELKTLRNTKAHKLVVGIPYLHSFDVERLRELAEHRLQAGNYQPYRFRRVIGGDQPDNEGFLLPKALIRKTAGAEMEGRPFWEEVKRLTNPA